MITYRTKNKNEIMNTKRLTIRILTDGDASFLRELMNTSGWYKNIGDRGIRTETDALNYIHDKMHPDIKVKGFVNHVMIEKSSNKPIGTCSVHNRDGVEGMDVGYALLPKFEGKGYATEGAQAMVNLALNFYGQTKVSGITNEANLGSCRVLEKLGFKASGYIQLPQVQERIKLFVFSAEK